MKAARLFVKAESENNGASGLKPFLEKSFNGYTMCRGQCLAPLQRRNHRRIQYPDQAALVVRASPAPNEFA